MGLNEQIKANRETPDPKGEWEKSKALLQTLTESGAIVMLSDLGASIMDNPLLNGPMSLPMGGRQVVIKKDLEVNDEVGIKKLAANSGDLPKGFQVETPSHNSVFSSQKLPRAIVAIFYNGKEYGYHTGGGFAPGLIRQWVPSGEYRTAVSYDILSVTSQEPGQLILWSGSNSHYIGEQKVVLKEEEWRFPGKLDEVLGELYKRRPATPTSQRK